jgi:3-methyladenine DNA glycosylase AlkD
VPEDLPWIKALILEKSWWDSVDFLATHAVGSLLERFPAHIRPVLETWIHDPNMWLNRSAIIAQILYRKNLDVDFLAMAILPHIPSKEFFLRKAIGWALRSHAARDPHWVHAFVEAHRAELSGLSIREALKHFR